LKIGLLNIDGHNFPNLALMKISSWHKKQGDNVEFATMFEHYDIIYKSKIFTYSVDPEYCYNTDNEIKGGTGFNIKSKLLNKIDLMFPDYSLYNCEHAYGFLTRGCPNKCPWCFVPEKEGDIKPYSDIDNFIGDFKSAILMDNNVLASDHGIRQIEKIIKKEIRVDFNQGLDARLIDDSVAKLLSKVKWIRFIRLACDSDSHIIFTKNAVDRIRKHKPKQQIFCYMLVKDIESANKRAEFLRSINVDPFAQAYRDKYGNEPDKRLKDFCTWVNTKPVFKTIPMETFIANRNR
jgi:hypothetical protein